MEALALLEKVMKQYLILFVFAAIVLGCSQTKKECLKECNVISIIRV